MNRTAMLMVVCLLSAVMVTGDAAEAEALADLPQAVQATVKHELSGAQIGEIDRDTKHGQVVYKIEAKTSDGKDIELQVVANGTLLQKEEEINLDKVPPAVRATIQKELGALSPKKIEQQVEVIYEVKAETADGKEIELEIASDGKLLDKDIEGGEEESKSAPVVSFKYVPIGLEIMIDGKPFATYYTGTSKIPRPYFANVKTPSGIQVTRNHPPIEGKDSTDHATYHPGIWLTFAGINGNDYWRLKQKTEHEMFIGKPKGGPGKGTFTVSNFYLDKQGNRIVHEICKYTIVARANYYLLIYDSTFSSDVCDFVFGDDQEYGLGIRVATPIEERYGGQILNADGLKGAEKVYGKASDWCDYSGVINDTLIGITVMPDPKNFRRSWYHARDYGLIAANPFGRQKVAGGKPSKVLVKKGEKFHLGFGVAVYSAPKGSTVNRGAMYAEYLEQIGRDD